MKIETKIISAFPGTGKTYCLKNKEICLDSDSSDFHLIQSSNKKVCNPEWPQNYINHIKENIGLYLYIFISSHKEVRDALKETGILFHLFYPILVLKSLQFWQY